MICNIVDNRTRKYRWQRINAVVEATWHDNSCQDADQAFPAAPQDEVVYDRREGISLHEAVTWANGQSCQVTLYLYDEGAGTNDLLGGAYCGP